MISSMLRAGWETLGEWKDWSVRWFFAPRQRVRPMPAVPASSGFMLTGPGLQEQIARCIELGQSVVLEGPRGCGKSFCAREGYKLAVKRGFIPQGAWVPVQGNKEIPRDYLAEDEIAFRLRPTGKDATKYAFDTEEDLSTQALPLEVWPARKDAPLFRFARRRLRDGSPIADTDSNRVLCKIDEQPCDRFVLFLDEINRFSDGVLDSLLGLLEERIAILAGREFELPVTVIMTMNPPGYDASARKLSPPLAARIGRTYRLNTPDIDTMCDLIAAGRLRKLQVERQVQAAGPAIVLALRDPDPLLLRKAALVTLCLWGDVTIADRPMDEGENKGAISLEYLTPDSKLILRQVMESDSEIANAMRSISGLCHYGPDGRAIADWIVSAAAAAIEEAGLQNAQDATIRPWHLESVAIRTLSHKMYDSFSAATRPDQTRAKEQAVAVIVSRILNNDAADSIIRRDLDDLPWFGTEIACKVLQRADQQPSLPTEIVHAVRSCFVLSRVTGNIELRQWQDILSSADLEVALLRHPGLFEPLDNSTNALGGFFDARYDDLIRLLARCGEVCRFGEELRAVLKQGPTDAQKAAWRAALTVRSASDSIRQRLRRAKDFVGAFEVVKANPELDSIFEMYVDGLVRCLTDPPVAGQTLSSFLASLPTPTETERNLITYVKKRLGPVRRPLHLEVGDRTAVRLIGLRDFVRQVSAHLGEGRASVLQVANMMEVCYQASKEPGDAWQSGESRNQLLCRFSSPFIGRFRCLSDLARAVYALGDVRHFEQAQWLGQLAIDGLSQDIERAKALADEAINALLALRVIASSTGLSIHETEIEQRCRELNKQRESLEKQSFLGQGRRSLRRAYRCLLRIRDLRNDALSCLQRYQRAMGEQPHPPAAAG